MVIQIIGNIQNEHWNKAMSIFNTQKQNIHEKDKCIFERFWIYQQERFPIFQNGLMIVVFTFSAISYSRLSREETTFITISEFIAGAATSFGFFLLLRLFDEFKDAQKDATFQSYRPVPRGLVSLKEMGWLAFLVIFIQLIFNMTVLPLMIGVYLLVMTYMSLMTKEFFLSKWLNDHPIVYMLSHMMIMPVIDFYTTGLDWINAEVTAPKGLIFFLIVTFLNGIVIEIGRKIKSKEKEEAGVVTYSSLWGSKNAAINWLVILFITFINANIACYAANFNPITFIFLILFICLCSIPGIKFIYSEKQQDARNIEIASGLWTIGMYLTLGAIPMILNLTGG